MGRPNRGTGSAGINERYDDDDYDDEYRDERYGNRGGRSGGSRSGMRRGGGGGRYSRY